MKKDWTKKCTCDNFQQNEDCEHIGNKILEEVGMKVEDSMGSYHIANIHIEEVGQEKHIHDGGDDNGLVDCLKCEKEMLRHFTKAIDPKNDLYLEPLNFDFDDVTSTAGTAYMFQTAINNIIKVLNKITKIK